MKKITNETIINFLKRAIIKKENEIDKINNWVNEFGPIGLEDHINYRNHLIQRIREIKQQIKELKNERI